MRPGRIKACVAKPNVRRRTAAPVHGASDARPGGGKQAHGAAVAASISGHLLFLSERQDVAKAAYWWDALEFRGALVRSDARRHSDGGSTLRRWE
jgi:hypothetical protein